MTIRRITRTTEITLESRWFGSAESAPLPSVARCPWCAAEVQLLTPEEAGELCGVSVREIYRLVEAGSIHFIETRQGRLWLCANSLTD